MLSRQLVLPGELRAMTHLGCTLARHCLQAALRYGRYHLGLPVTTVPPVPIVHLRPYLDGDPADPFDDLVLHPGADTPPTLPRRVQAALTFHRLRLRLPRRRPPSEEVRGEPWPALRRRVGDWVPVLGDALLLELIAVQRRRHARSRGKARPPCSSPQTQRGLAAARPPTADVGVAGVAYDVDPASLPKPDPPRGALRDAWLAAAADLRPRLLDWSRDAVQRELLATPRDVFFLPFDHLDVLAGEQAPHWLASAVDANRGEWSALTDSEAPPDVLPDRNVGVRLRRAGKDRLPSVWAPLP